MVYRIRFLLPGDKGLQIHEIAAKSHKEALDKLGLILSGESYTVIDIQLTKGKP